MTDADPASTLAEIRGRGYRNGATGAKCARLSDSAAIDVPLLVAALDVVLKLAEEWKTDAAAIARRVEGHAARGDGHAAAFARGSAEALDDCVRTLREAISRELSGTRQTQPGEDGES